MTMANDTTTLQARPTTYKGIQMRSRLEAGFAQWLDQVGADWDYEPECFATEEGQYLPDFVVRDVWVLWLDRVGDIYIETKPYRPDRSVELYDRCTRIIEATKPDAFFLILWPDIPEMTRYPWVQTPRGLAVSRRLPEPWEGEWWKGGGA